MERACKAVSGYKGRRRGSSIEIQGGAITASGGTYGAGIGSGGVRSKIGTILIDTDGNMNAYEGLMELASAQATVKGQFLLVETL